MIADATAATLITLARTVAVDLLILGEDLRGIDNERGGAAWMAGDERDGEMIAIPRASHPAFHIRGMWGSIGRMVKAADSVGLTSATVETLRALCVGRAGTPRDVTPADLSDAEIATIEAAAAAVDGPAAALFAGGRKTAMSVIPRRGARIASGQVASARA